MENIREKLLNLSDEKHRKFNAKLCPDTKLKILGIRVPIIREVAKEIAQSNYLQEYLSTYKNEYFEEVLLKGLVIRICKNRFKRKNKLNKRIYSKYG